MRRPSMILFLIAMLLGIATGDLVVAKEPPPASTNGTELAMQADTN